MDAGTERPEAAFVRDALDGSRFARVRWIAETGSTNADLLEVARTGGPEQVLITDLQTAGKGRRDRVWDAPSGSSILMSVLVRGTEPQDGFWSVGAIALAASQAIDAVVSSTCSLKWPNDVMIGERKVAGVFAQLVDDAVVIGIGINVNWPKVVPPALAERGTAVNRHRGTGSEGEAPILERGPLAADILQRAIGHLEADRATLRANWKAQCATLGQDVRIELESTKIVGEAVDIAPDGGLILEHHGVQTTHQVGDVVHLRPNA